MLFTTGCEQAQQDNIATPETTRVSHGYWLWRQADLAQVNSRSDLNNDANYELVLYQGNFINQADQQLFIKKGVAVQAIKNNSQVSLLLRLYQLPEPDYFIEQVEYLINRWQKAGVKVVGIQLDHDSPSKKLSHYREFLAQISQHFGKNFISVTGLATWLTDNINGVNQLAEVIDYIAVQFYQAYHPVASSQRFNHQLRQLKLNYKIGITTSPLFAELSFSQSEYYLGTLTFLNGHTL